VEPLAAEGLLAGLREIPVAEGIVGVGAGAQADLAPLSLRDALFVLVEDLHVPAGHRTAHRPLSHLHERVVRAEWVGLGEAVVVEHRDPVLVAEPTDRLGVERLAGAAHDPERLRVALACVGDGHHRPHRGRRSEHVGDPVAGEKVELLVGLESRFALVDALQGAEAPRAEQRGDPGRPGPLAHPVEALAVADVVAVDELLVGEDVAVGVDDALRHPGGAGGVVELCWVVGGGVLADRVGGPAGEEALALVEDEQLVDE
jgi:hypothetical protein